MMTSWGTNRTKARSGSSSDPQVKWYQSSLIRQLQRPGIGPVLRRLQDEIGGGVEDEAHGSRG